MAAAKPTRWAAAAKAFLAEESAAAAWLRARVADGEVLQAARVVSVHPKLGGCFVALAGAPGRLDAFVRTLDDADGITLKVGRALRVLVTAVSPAGAARPKVSAMLGDGRRCACCGLRRAWRADAQRFEPRHKAACPCARADAAAFAAARGAAGAGLRAIDAHAKHVAARRGLAIEPAAEPPRRGAPALTLASFAHAALARIAEEAPRLDEQSAPADASGEDASGEDASGEAASDADACAATAPVATDLSSGWEYAVKEFDAVSDAASELTASSADAPKKPSRRQRHRAKQRDVRRRHDEEARPTPARVTVQSAGKTADEVAALVASLSARGVAVNVA